MTDPRPTPCPTCGRPADPPPSDVDAVIEAVLDHTYAVGDTGRLRAHRANVAAALARITTPPSDETTSPPGFRAEVEAVTAKEKLLALLKYERERGGPYNPVSDAHEGALAALEAAVEILRCDEAHDDIRALAEEVKNAR